MLQNEFNDEEESSDKENSNLQAMMTSGDCQKLRFARFDSGFNGSFSNQMNISMEFMQT